MDMVAWTSAAIRVGRGTDSHQRGDRIREKQKSFDEAKEEGDGLG